MWSETAFKRSQASYRESELEPREPATFGRIARRTVSLRYDVRLMFSRRTDWRLAANRFTNALDEARASGSELIDLTISNPTRAGLIYDSAAILDALRNDRSLDYDPQSNGKSWAQESFNCPGSPKANARNDSRSDARRDIDITGSVTLQQLAAAINADANSPMLSSGIWRCLQ